MEACVVSVQSKIETASLHSAMALAFGEIESATKTANNPHFKSRYADITAVIDAIKPALIKHGLFFTQRPQMASGGVCIETVVGHAGGEEMSLGVLFVPANKNDAQAFGSALTYARRYALVTAFGVPTEDDDGNAASKSPPANDAPPKKESAHSALKTAVRGFVREMEGCADWDMWVAYRDSKEAREILAQVQEKLPEWWETGIGMPEEFIPLRRRIELMEANFANQIADVAMV